MTRPTILICDRYSAEAVAHLRANLDAHIVMTENRPSIEELKTATALLIRSRTVIEKELLGLAPNLKVVISATSGFDHIDLEECKKHNVVVMHTPMANRQSAAEHTLLLILATLRRLRESDQLLRSGQWKDTLTTGHELAGKTVGVIGLGRVGTRVAELVKAFGAHVIAHDPYQSDEVFQRLSIQRMGMTEVFAQADILTLHVPLTSETRRLIRNETLEYTQEGLILVNASRGRVIDESALVAALDSGQIAAAGLDVFENEPLARESRLRKLPNVVLTPHIGAHTEEAYLRASLEAVSKVIEFLSLQDTSRILNASHFDIL